MDIVGRMEHASWRNSNDVFRDFDHLKNLMISFRTEKEVMLTFPDDNIRILFKVAYNTGIVVFK